MQYKKTALLLFFAYAFSYTACVFGFYHVLEDNFENAIQETKNTGVSPLLEQFNQGEMPTSDFLWWERGCSLYEEHDQQIRKLGSFNLRFYKTQFPGTYLVHREAQKTEVKSFLWKKSLKFILKDDELRAEFNNINYSMKKERGGNFLIIKINKIDTFPLFAICNNNVRTYIPKFFKGSPKKTLLTDIGHQ